MKNQSIKNYATMLIHRGLKFLYGLSWIPFRKSSFLYSFLFCIIFLSLFLLKCTISYHSTLLISVTTSQQRSVSSFKAKRYLSSFFQAFAAGWLEGHVTSEILYMYWQNTVDGYCDGKEKLCDKIVEFVNKNTAWVKGKNL